MSSKRIAGGAGIITVVLLVVSGFSAGSPPKTSDSAAKIGRYFLKHRSALLRADYVGMLAGFFFLIFAAGLWALARSRERERGDFWSIVGILGAVMTAGLAVASTAVHVTLALRIGQLGPQFIRVLFDVQSAVGAGIGVGIAAFLVGLGTAARRSSSIPGWLAWFGYAIAVVGLIAVGGAASTATAFAALGFVTFLGFLVWVLVAAAKMFAEGAPAG